MNYFKHHLLSASLIVGVLTLSLFAQDIKTGLTAHYLLNGNAIDTTANTNDGIINGPVPAIDRNGNAGGAYYFDGSNDYIMVKHNSSIDIGSGSFTIAAWVKPGSSTGNWFDVVAKRNPYSTPGWCLQMCYGPEIKLWTSSDEMKGYNYTFQQDAWYFVATVRDTATGTLTYYINGVKSAPIAYSKANESNPAAMAIGKLSEESHQYFHGSIDELRLYNRALTPYDLDSLYKVNNPSPIDTIFAQDIKTGLTAHYLLNGNAIDTTANTNDGIINGPVPAIDRNGNAGGAYYFDGIDDYIMVKHNSSIDIGSGSFTIAAWVKPGSSTGNWFDVVAKRNSNQTGWVLAMAYGPEIKMWISSDMDKSYSYSFQQDVWYFVATVRDTATGTLTYYINGVKSAPMAFSKANESNLAAMAIGKLSEESHQYFHGSIDELRLYTRALSIYDLDSLYKVNNPFPIDTITPPPANPACIAHWSFDSSYQQTFYDVTRNGYDLINSGSAAINLNAGVYGKAFECTSTLFKGIVKNSQGNFNSKNFSIEAWIYSNVDLVNPGSFYNYHEIFSYQSVASGLSEGYNLEIRADGKIHLGIARTDGIEHWIVCPSDSVLKLRTWYYVAGTYDGSAMKLYINGKLAKLVAYSGGYEIPHDNAVIGCQMLKDGTYRNWFNGKIDELKLYNYALDSATIARTYNANVPQAEAPFEINLGMKQAFAKAGDTVTIPIYLTNYEDFAISSCQFTMHIDPSVIRLFDVAKDSGLAKNWTLAFNPARPDSIIIGMAGVSQTLAYGEGELIRCRFIVSSSAAANSFSTIDLRHINVDEANKLVIATTTSGKISIKQPTFMYGDVTGNKAVTIGDAQKVLEYVVGSLTLPDASCPNFTTAVADVSGNGIITSYDAALISQYSVGLISKFPVESTGMGKRLAKSTATGAPAAIVSIALPHLISTNIYQYTVHAENIYGLRAGEFAFACDPAIVKSIKDVSAGVRSANIQAQFDAATNRYKVGLTTNDRVTDLASDLLTITVEHKAGVAGTGLGISTALLNEGTIETNFLNQGLQTGATDNTFGGMLSHNIPFELTITNHDIQIGNPKGNAVSVQLFNLQGRRMFSKSFSTGTIKVSVGLTGRSAGLYICRIATGGKAYDRAIMIAQ